MTSARAYRGPIGIEEAVELVRAGAGRHFDPALADTLLQLHTRGELATVWDEGAALADEARDHRLHGG